ncbi:uncharacterized protein LOC128875762 [Hylaeus volcanicus]|uniref:uncharacterized protein LOC128875762 n=1 Tax=Hylaeus volcanicus TaxID=313075 RepID=UPI0023B812BD|nr:uncharacterized protein LOC128875762 [Hylaeus volcanicus]
MDECNEFYKKIQTYLMKKNQECGELQFLTSRTTSASIGHIDDICNTIINIFEMSNISIKEKASINNERCIQAYTYLLLNTKFKNQERLEEDIVSGHLVDMFPPLSSYLLVQILWSLQYEKILIQSILHMPFDLCTEILEILKQCIEELPLRRSIDSIYQTIFNVYIKFILLKETGIQSTDLEKSIQNLLMSFEEFLLLLTNPAFTLTTSTNLKECDRYGIMIKKLIATIRSCFEYKSKGICVSKDTEKLYNITFGREPFIKCEDTLIESTMMTLNQQLMDLLSNKVKEINCEVYMGWVELDDEENNMISLQRAIGNECYYFIELMQKSKELSQNTHLIECLQHLSSKPDPNQSSFVLSLQELCCAISDGKKEFMKELLCRYQEWDNTILDFVYTNKSLLDKKDCFHLLEYLTFVLKESNEEGLKEICYSSVTRILSLQDIPDLYEIIMMYLTKHDGENSLESLHTEETFNEFISRNSNLQKPTNLKIVLLFLLKNLKLILGILVKITIGHHQYKNILISANDLLLLSPFFILKESNGEILLIDILRTICIENNEWNEKKFIDFTQVALNSSIVNVNDLINNVFVPYLENDNFNVRVINSVLNNIRKLQVSCTKDTNVKNLIIVLAKKMCFLRKSANILKFVSSEIFNLITSILEYFLETKSYRISACTKKQIMYDIESFIEPIDKLHFASLWYLTEKGVSIIDIVTDYERRCFTVLNRLKEDPKSSERLRNYLSDLNLLREDFLRHMIIRTTDVEYQILASEFTIIYWFAFGCNNEIEAFNDFLRITIEACCLSLEHPSIGSNDLFAYIFKSFMRFCTTFVSLEGMKEEKIVCQSLINNFNQLSGSIKHSPYAHLFITYNNMQHKSEHLQNVLNILYAFCDECVKLNYECSRNTQRIPRSPKISNFYKTYEVISTCMKVPATEAYECIRRMNELFASN